MPLGARQSTLLLLVQLEVRHTERPTDKVAVMLLEPNCSPYVVIETPPLVGPFQPWCQVRTGASYVNAAILVHLPELDGDMTTIKSKALHLVTVGLKHTRDV
jgi:hypothetical protein